MTNYGQNAPRLCSPDGGICQAVLDESAVDNAVLGCGQVLTGRR